MIDESYMMKEIKIRNTKKNYEFDMEANENLMQSIKNKLQLIDHLD